MVALPKHDLAIHHHRNGDVSYFLFYTCDEMSIESAATNLDAKVFVMSVASLAHVTCEFFY